MRKPGDCARSGDQGFVLIVVLWGLGVLLVLVASFSVTTRSFTKATANRVINAQAQAHAETGVHMALMALIAGRAGRPDTAPAVPLDGVPYACKAAAVTTLVITIDDEAGKVDLNGASAGLLQRLFSGFADDARHGEVATRALLDFRDADDVRRNNGAEARDYTVAGLAFGPSNAPLFAVEELEQVLGVSRELYLKVRPFVTVHSRRSGVDPTVASPTLLAALGGKPPPKRFDARSIEGQREDYLIPRKYNVPSDKTAYTVRVEVHRPSGGLFVQEVVIELLPSRSPPYRYLAWRQGHEARYAPSDMTEENCFATGR